jgi:NAD(P)-dependent dehydrogenase (short-subunit alcohol dehydrogenase family)
MAEWPKSKSGLALVKDTVKKFSRLDILVNNAGIFMQTVRALRLLPAKPVPPAVRNALLQRFRAWKPS